MEIRQHAALVPELSCSDFSISLDFYTKKLGFRILYDRPEQKFAYIALGDAQLMLEQSNGFWETAELQKPYGRGINFQIFVDDIQASQNNLIKLVSRYLLNLKPHGTALMILNAA